MLHELGYGLEQIIAPRHLKLVTARIIPCVKINKDQIIQVIYNLVENAAKYSPPDSTITIAVEKSETGAVISVSDQGAGISKKDQCNIFDSLHHAKMISSGLKKGTGLGLYICNNIVEAHGGRIWLYSKKGKGSTFYFSLLA